MSVHDADRAFRNAEVTGQRGNDGVIGAPDFGRFADFHYERPIPGRLDARLLRAGRDSDLQPHVGRIPKEAVVAKPVTIEGCRVAFVKAVAAQRQN